MIIEIHQPELEHFIHERMKTGEFESIEDLLMQALTMATDPEPAQESTGADLIAAMQACPVKEIDIDPERYPMPVRDVAF